MAAPEPSPPWWLQARVRRAWQLLLVLLLLAVTALALTPAPPPQADTGWDKANHLLAFATLALVAELALAQCRARRWWTAGGLLAHGALIELLQTQLPPRSGEWADLAADAVGIVLGLWLAWPLLPRQAAGGG
jgi:VanZ family protein